MPFDLSVLDGFSVKFRYTNGWLESAYGFGPINLPLSLESTWVEISSEYEKLGALFDAGPDM